MGFIDSDKLKDYIVTYMEKMISIGSRTETRITANIVEAIDIRILRRILSQDDIMYDPSQSSANNAKEYKTEIDILGIPYTIKKCDIDEDIAFKTRGIQGYCDDYNKIIVYLNLDTVPSWNIEDEETKRKCEAAILRHEIVHAFLSESGHNSNSHGTECWAKDEEIVEWIATQGPKLYKAWEDAGAL